MAFVIESERLVLRELSAEDSGELAKILQDDEVMYAYEGAFSDVETQEWLDRQIARYREYGFGLWAVILKNTGEMIGQCGLTMQPWNGRQLLEVGYLFRKDFWHNGYATEAAKACMDYAFDVLHAGQVCSIIRDTNVPSQNVALRNGLVFTGETLVKHYRGTDMPHFLYVCDNPAGRTVSQVKDDFYK